MTSDLLLGCVRSPVDHRDHVVTRTDRHLSVCGSVLTKIEHLPDEFSWRGSPELPPVRRQKKSDCVAFALSTIHGFNNRRETDNGVSVNPDVTFSPAYLYRQCKEIDGLPPGVEGTYIRTGLHVLKHDGCLRESDWPYDASTPNLNVVLDIPYILRSFRARAYAGIDIRDTVALQAAIVDIGPVCAGITVYSDWKDASRIIWPPRGYKLGGHAVAVVGYRSNGWWEIQNSWGDGWGDAGYCLVHDSYMQRACYELWILYDAPSPRVQPWYERLLRRLKNANHS